MCKPLRNVEGCQTLPAIQQEQPHRAEAASSEDSSPPSSDDGGLYAGLELACQSRDWNVSNLAHSLLITCMVPGICDSHHGPRARDCLRVVTRTH